MDFPAVIYSACFAACACCAFLLFRTWIRVRVGLLLWIGGGFVFLTIRNCLLLFDKVITPEIDLSVWRVGLSIVALAVVGYGLFRKAA